MYTFFNKMPKIELHCHLDGSVPINVIETLLPDDKKNLIYDLKNTVGKNHDSLLDYLKCFDITLLCLQTKDNLELSAYELMKDLSKENIVYIEIRFSPILCMNEGLSIDEVMDSVIKGLEKGKKEFDIEYGLILCFMRHHDNLTNNLVLDTARNYLGKGVCALDLAGNEADYPPLLFKQLFLDANNSDIPFTIHAGECGNADNILDSINLGAKRIGHGIAMKDNDAIIKKCSEKGIGVEICPTSNFQTKAVSDLEQYPFKKFMENNIKVSINTDNRMVSNTDLTNELFFLHKNFGLTKKQAYQLMINAVDTSFAKDEIKRILYNKINSFMEN